MPENAFTTGLGWEIACAVSGKAFPCRSTRLVSVTVSYPGTIGALNVTRKTSSLGCSKVVAMSGSATTKCERSFEKTGSIASSNVKSITRPYSSWARFWSAETSVGGVVSPVALPPTGAEATAVSATLWRFVAASVKLAWRFAFVPSVTSRTCEGTSSTKVDPARSRVLPSVASAQFARASASLWMTWAPLKATEIVSPPSPGFWVPDVITKVGAAASLVVTA